MNTDDINLIIVLEQMSNHVIQRKRNDMVEAFKKLNKLGKEE